MKVLGLKIEKLPNVLTTYGVSAHGLSIDIIRCSGMWRASARIGGLVIGSPIRTTKEEAAEALDAGLREQWGAMAMILAESRK